MPRLLHRCGVECYVTGNYSRAETQQLGQHVEQLLKVSSQACFSAFARVSSHYFLSGKASLQILFVY